MIERSVKIKVTEGLHARPATKFAQAAKSFQATVELVKGGKTANGKSAVKLMLLTVKEQDEIVLRVAGDDEVTAFAELSVLLEGALDEHETAAEVVPTPKAAPAHDVEQADNGALSGIAAADGTALGPALAFVVKPIVALRERIATDEITGELQRFARAVEKVCARLSKDHDRIDVPNESVATNEEQIIAALIELARDPEFTDPVNARIASGEDAVHAVLEAGADLSQQFEAVADPYLRQRAEDLRGIVKHVSLELLGREDIDLSRLPQPTIILAEEISAWDFARIDSAKVLGLAVARGGATSHVAIMARSLGIPAIVGIKALLSMDYSSTQSVALDGRTGIVVLDPDAATCARFEAQRQAELREKQKLLRLRDIAPQTRSGRKIEIAANIATLAEIDGAKAQGAMGVGLFRTELMFMEYGRPPTEIEQTEIYTRLLEAFHPHRVIVRTLDVGGDKPVPGIDFPREENPFLGWRGIRMCLDRPEIFKPQLRALLRAAIVGNLDVMVPMIADADEVRIVRALIAECKAELDAAGIPSAMPRIGVMMETPAAVFMAEEIARLVDFFSIGTNDLTQYIMAADRTNERLAHLNKADHPAVLAAIRHICQAAQSVGIWVGVCGEAAGRPEIIPTLINYGVDELSMSPSLILRAKELVMGL